MEKIITKELIEKLMKTEGETRAISIKGDLEFILYKKGEEGLRKLEDELEKFGHPIKYKKLEDMSFYPVGLEALVFLAAEKLFNFSKEDFVEMGEFNAKVSLIVRLFMKYFVSMDSMAKESPKFWRKYYTNGDLSIVELDKEKKYAIARIENFALSPSHCCTLKGYFLSVVKMILGHPISCEETKCTFRGDEYHEFKLTW